MCEPTWFDVSYKINTFMDGNIGRVDKDLAKRQWARLYEVLVAEGAKIDLIPPQPLPDMVFTANAGLIWKGTVIPAKFWHSERQSEEPFFLEWFQTQGYRISSMPDKEAFEGEGDVVIRKDCLFMGHNSRTTRGAALHLEAITGLEVVSLELNPDGFYHLDTCMVSQGTDDALIYYPDGFTKQGLAEIERRTPAHLRVTVTEEEALAFACNTVMLGNTAVFPTCPPSYAEKLKKIGLKPVMVDLSEFMKAGGAAKCLCLWLDRAE